MGRVGRLLRPHLRPPSVRSFEPGVDDDDDAAGYESTSEDDFDGGGGGGHSRSGGGGGGGGAVAVVVVGETRASGDASAWAASAG